MRKALLFSLLAFLPLTIAAQPRITKIEKLPLEQGREWSNPKFSPDGRSIFFTTADYHGIWVYDISTRQQRLVTDDPRSGFGFEISSDGKTVAYRRTLNEHKLGGRIQEIVTKNIVAGTTEFIGSGDNLSTPIFVGTVVIFADNVALRNASAIPSMNRPVVLGIENSKIALLVNGGKRLLDPLKHGNYIWPVLSPDGKKLVATEMSRGAFICDLQGRVITKLGRRNGAVWTRSGKWLIYMNDKDDGHDIIASDLYAVSVDGKTTRQLTTTKDVIELYPHVSPVGNTIVCSTLSGDILLMTYQEGK